MRNAESRLGILAFLGGTALVLVAIVAFARYPSLFRRGSEYRAAFRNVAGLNLGDEVRYGGLIVGSVTRLTLDPQDPTRIEVTFRVGPQTPMRTDTYATITQVGLLGQPYLNLEAGLPTSPVLAPRSRVPTRDNLTFQDAMSRLAIFLDRADTLLHGVERIAASSPWDRIDRTLSRVDGLLMNAAAGSERVIDNLDQATRQLSGMLERTERLVVSLDTAFRGASPALRQAQREALAAMRDLRAVLGDVRDATGDGDRLARIVDNLTAASEDLARFADRLEKEPTSVLSRRQPPKKTAGPAAQ
jgi:phospholipid/cholesterol/gamma-HCH transport system substrate-binding protein